MKMNTGILSEYDQIYFGTQPLGLTYIATFCIFAFPHADFLCPKIVPVSITATPLKAETAPFLHKSPSCNRICTSSFYPRLLMWNNIDEDLNIVIWNS